jgi:hypothetical protein
MKNSLSKTHITPPPPVFRRNVLILLFFLTQIPLHLYAQNQRIKKEIDIRNTIDRKGSSSIDTLFISEYDTNGIIIREVSPYHDKLHTITISRWYFQTIEKKITIDSTIDKIHSRLFFANSSYGDEFMFFYKDSIVILRMDDEDTIYNRVNYMKDKKLYKSLINYKLKCVEICNADTSIISEVHNDKFIYIKNNIFFIEAIGVRDEDTTKSSLNKIFHIRKEYSYDFDENKWGLVTKKRNNSKNQLVKETKIEYGEKTKTKFKYNSSGKLTSEISRTSHCGKTKIFYTYIYEYYETD